MPHVCISAPQENPGLQVCLMAPIQMFGNVQTMEGKRDSQVKILTMHHKEGKNSQATEIIEVIPKGSTDFENI